jgi:hypothetical protein
MVDRLKYRRLEFQLEYVRNERDKLAKELDLFKIHICSRYVSVWQKRLLAMSFSSWKGLLSDTRSLERKAKTFILRLQHKTAAMALMIWEYKMQETRRMTLLESRSIRRWICSALSSSFQSWVDMFEQKRKLTKLDLRAVIQDKRSKRSILSEILRTWNENSRHERCISRVAIKITLRWQNRATATSFFTWQVHYDRTA